MSRFTLNPAEDDHPVWSPDSARIVFSSNRDSGVANLYTKPSNGTGPEELLLKSDYSKIPLSWSSDGYVAYEESDPKTKSDLWVLSMKDKQPIPFLNTPFNETQAQFSPDGRWIAYVSDQTGRQEVYVRSFPRSRSEWPVSTSQGFQPRWRPDGRGLFFISSEGTEDFMAVDIDAKASDGSLRIGAPRKIFQFGVISQNQRNSYDVFTGQRFVLNVLPRPNRPVITVILNWTAGLNPQ
jgi:Tol biopolymer transport system component